MPPVTRPAPLRTPPQNAAMQLAGRTLALVVDLDVNLGPTKRGRADVIANTHGLVEIPGEPGPCWYQLLVIRRSSARAAEIVARKERRLERARKRLAKAQAVLGIKPEATP